MIWFGSFFGPPCPILARRLAFNRKMIPKGLPMSGPNTLSPNLMSPSERRAALCAILALGLLRLGQRNGTQIPEVTRESSLHFRPEQSGSRHANDRRLP